MPASRRRSATEASDVNPYARAAEQRLRLDRRDPDALFARAAFLARGGNLEAAALTLNRLCEIDPDYPGLWRFLARLYREIGDDRLRDLCLARATMTG